MTKTRGDVITLIIVTVIVTLFAAWVSGGVKKSVASVPKNIFDEIYYDIERNYRTGAVAFRDVEGIDIPTYGGIDYDPEEPPTYTYDNDRLPNNYDYARIETNLPKSKTNIVFISFYKKLNKYSLYFINTYDSGEKLLKQNILLTPENGYGDTHSYSDQDAQDFLAQHSITSEDLDSYNEAILNDVVLTDWTTVYHSRFSPDDYGDVEVTKQW